MNDPPRPPKTPPPAPPLAEEIIRRDMPAAKSLSPHLRESLIGLELDRFWAVFWLALSSLFVATLSLAPVIKRWLDPLPTSTDWDRWIYLLIWFAVLQSAYVLLFVHLPHWVLLRSSALFSLMLGCVYAAGLALFTFSQPQSSWVVWLDLADEQQRGTTYRWCLIMLCLLLPVAYFQGKTSSQWRQREGQLFWRKPDRED